MLVSAGSVVDAAGNLLHSTTVHVDITEHKRAEEALSTVSQRLIEAQEEERTWIMRELHDDISQRIMLEALKLENPERRSSRIGNRTGAQHG